MKQSKLSRLPKFVRSIFLPRKSSIESGITPVNRFAVMDSESVGRVDDVLPPMNDLSALFAQLKSPEADTARDAAIELGRTGDRTALEPLLEVLNNAHGFFHPLVRAAAARSLGQIKDCRATDALIAATADGTAEISEEAAIALGAIGEERAVDPLMNIVANKTGYYLQPVRRAAIVSLGDFRSAKVASLLLAVSVNESEDPIVRQAAKDVGAHR